MSQANQPSVFKRYWNAYGGLKALARSRYLWIAFSLNWLTYSLWSKPGWWDTPLSVLPNLLGFTLGTFALVVTLGDEKFKAILSKAMEDGSSAPMMQMSATFFHFILVQVVSLLLAVIFKARVFATFIEPSAEAIGDKGSLSIGLLQIMVLVGWFIGNWIFIYGLTLCVAAGIEIFRVVKWFTDYSNRN